MLVQKWIEIDICYESHIDFVILFFLFIAWQIKTNKIHPSRELLECCLVVRLVLKRLSLFLSLFPFPKKKTTTKNPRILTHACMVIYI